MARWTESTGHGAQVYGPSLNDSHPSNDLRPRSKAEGIFSRSNLGRWRVDGRLTTLNRVAAAWIGRRGCTKAAGGGGSSN
jgi:hypothetical protein